MRYRNTTFHKLQVQNSHERGWFSCIHCSSEATWILSHTDWQTLTNCRRIHCLQCNKITMDKLWWFKQLLNYVSRSASYLGTSNFNIYCNAGELTVNTTGCNFWASLYNSCSWQCHSTKLFSFTHTWSIQILFWEEFLWKSEDNEQCSQ
jgi:hypothetical protein